MKYKNIKKKTFLIFQIYDSYRHRTEKKILYFFELESHKYIYTIYLKKDCFYALIVFFF